MPEMHETEVQRDADGRVVGYRERIGEQPRRRGGGFGWGLLFGAILVAIAIIAFAYNRGSFQSAGRAADQATVQAQQQLHETQQQAANQTPQEHSQQ